jgi:hypothetical protein
MKTPSFDLSNAYVRRARLQPAMLVALPLGLATLAWSPGGVVGWSLVWSLFVFCGGTALMAQVARDRGKKKEPELFRSWGGKPTTRLLRHRDAPNKTLLGRRHQKLQRLVKGVKIPSVDEELADPGMADEVYEACTAFLLEKTRKKAEFPLVFEENCNYGFRRNLWGMKPLGASIALLGTLAVALLLILNHRSGVSPSPIVLVCAVLNLLLLLGWLIWFTPDWVRLAADAYAERLLAACEKL